MARPRTCLVLLLAHSCLALEMQLSKSALGNTARRQEAESAALDAANEAFLSAAESETESETEAFDWGASEQPACAWEPVPQYGGLTVRLELVARQFVRLNFSRCAPLRPTVRGGGAAPGSFERTAEWRAAKGGDSHGRVVWPSSLVLAAWLEAHPELARGKRVVELGCGVGVGGLTAAKLGALVRTMLLLLLLPLPLLLLLLLPLLRVLILTPLLQVVLSTDGSRATAEMAERNLGEDARARLMLLLVVLFVQLLFLLLSLLLAPTLSFSLSGQPGQRDRGRRALRRAAAALGVAGRYGRRQEELRPGRLRPHDRGGRAVHGHYGLQPQPR